MVRAAGCRPNRQAGSLPHILYGIISAVDVRGALADRVMHEGLYLATAGDENFKLVKPPRGFKPKAFAAK